MKSRRMFSLISACALLLPSLGMLAGCSGDDAIVLKVYSWEEYIDDGGKGSYDADFETDEAPDPIISKFERWYTETYPDRRPVRVEYSTFGTNEDMYNEIKLGNEYDLLCPSDYMIMKLAAEGYLTKYDKSFFDPAIETNYYVRNVSPFIAEKFESNAGLALYPDADGEPILWKDYAAGYMWGTTGFVYNPEADVKDAQGNHIDLGSLLEETGWQIFVDSKVGNKITAKDNVRDTYFAAIGVTFEDELLSLDRSADDYIEKLTAYFNATDEETIAEVEPTLMDIKNNIYSFETDTGKADMVSEKIWLNYAWSGDAVYALDEAETPDLDENGDPIEGTELYLNYFVPEAGTNLWFDGWVMMDCVEERGTKEAAQAFVNYMSRPESAMRNSYYIGYTSVIAGANAEMLEYIDLLYGEEEENEGDFYNLSYFFPESEDGSPIGIYADEEQRTCRQLFAQFPPEEVISRCAVMDYYREDASDRINELWSRVKSETLDVWAIVVICLCVVAIALFTVYVKLGSKIDLFRSKPKKGYHRIDG